MQGMSYPPCKGAPNTIDLFDQSRLYRLDQSGNERATSTHKLVSFSGLMHRNEVIHDQEEHQSVLSGAGCKRHLLAEECTILKELPVALLLLHTACALLRMRERADSERT